MQGQDYMFLKSIVIDGTKKRIKWSQFSANAGFGTS